jgi:hypothetical protein
VEEKGAGKKGEKGREGNFGGRETPPTLNSGYAHGQFMPCLEFALQSATNASNPLSDRNPITTVIQYFRE